MSKIVVIDGSSNAGKTTLCNLYAQRFDNVFVVQGASQFVNERKEYYPDGIPKVPSSREEELENQKFFFKLEFHRLKFANQMIREGKNVIMDRNVLEILAVAYSLEKEKKYEGVYQNACALYNDYKKAAQQLGLKLPDKYIILYADQNVLEARNQTRNNMLSSDWIKKSLIDNQKQFFSRFLDKYKNKAVGVNTTNKSKNEVLNEVENILNLGKVEIDDDRSTHSH